MSRKWPEQDFAVSLVGDEITCRWPNGEVQAVSASRLRDIHVETNDSGPWGLDVWFLLNDLDGRELSFPLGALGEKVVINHLIKLPGFEMKGMNSATNARFRCWPPDDEKVGA